MKYHPCLYVVYGKEQFKCKKTGDYCIAQRYCTMEKQWVPNHCETNCKYFVDRKTSKSQEQK